MLKRSRTTSINLGKNGKTKDNDEEICNRKSSWLEIIISRVSIDCTKPLTV